MIDFRDDELKAILTVMSQISFKAGQSKEMSIVEGIMQKITVKLKPTKGDKKKEK